eukprot:TRINITY_DN64846_c0_g1_i1.p2 TRINITY_DN64846_c0_g1~~TRINITY_DN64846_c0_g1_i1.p2  ORF type:complete len:121 (+),score=16.38 TRINITY_DN64846_c0_g1_i1:306-668(+)
MFSNESIEGIRTNLVAATMYAPLGGLSHTSMNTGVFIAVWRAIFRSGRCKRHAWTVKVDPDSAFLPERLQAVLAQRSWGLRTSQPTFLLNAASKLQAPIEVLSRAAMEANAEGASRCEEE